MGKVNRTSEEKILPGGKGINVSIVLKNLGIASTPLGFVAGFTGQEIIRRLEVSGIHGKFIEIQEGNSRINMKLRSLDEKKNVIKESEVNGMGPLIDEQSWEIFCQQLEELGVGDILVLAGSIPASLPQTIYRDIMDRVIPHGVQVVVDAGKELLVNVLEKEPFLVKPNHHELGEIFGVEISSREEALIYAKKLQEMGAKNVLVSMAGQGAVLVDEQNNTYEKEAPEGVVINSVGAGDSMVAGFLYGYLKEKNYKSAFEYGLCAGSASAFSENLATNEEIEALR